MIDERHLFQVSQLFSSPKYDFTPEVLAYHEVGHVIVKRALGSTPSKVAINRNKLIGITISKKQIKPDTLNVNNEFEALPLSFRRLVKARLAAIYRAGEICERILTGTTVKGVVLTGSHDDIKARIALSQVGLSGLSQYPDLLAKKILMDKWKEVEQVANQLLDKGVIYYK